MAACPLRGLTLRREEGTATALDHVGLVGPDGPALHAEFERLGFRLTPLSRQSGRLHPNGPVESWGSANRCAMLRHGYIELLAIIDPVLPANGLDRLLARYPGMHILALRMQDEAANLDRLRRTGLDVPGILHLERAVDDTDPCAPRARFARLPLPEAPEGRIQLIRHLTPEAIWQERFMTHPNRAASLDAAILAVADPAATAARLSRLAGRPVTPDPVGGFTLELAHGTVRILAPEGLCAVLPGLHPPTLPFMAGLVVRTEDEAQAVRALVPDLRPVPAGAMTTAGGAGIVFC
ncbi:MAG: VOC family protein [Acetobacteraceae bacterium]|nr:VOC family protein [Acetobacteraceae bacterium]